MEFVKPSSNTYLTIGIGFRARRGKKLDCWHFILKDGRRINKELKLYKKREEKKFALTDKEFKNALGEGNIYTTSPKEYMEKVNELFNISYITVGLKSLDSLGLLTCINKFNKSL